MKYSIVAALIVMAVVAAGAVDARPASLTGDWTLSVEHLGLKLTLDQKKSTVTGTLDWPHGDPIMLTGLFADDTLIFSGDSAGENFTIHIDSTGTRKADGTLTGTLKAHFDEFNDEHQVMRVRNQEIPWTATRGLHDLTHFPR
ncbi:MAG TPA: hypothetical protein VL173_00015 [Vicinamibacterales bacterium]|jgi:hypothetical protein|nr:hypothetical protein [Vicinamibacterales bacterium]